MCRKAGLEKKRRCGWSQTAETTGSRVVWARKQVSLEICPTSYVTAESLALVEEFFVRRRLGWPHTEDLSARQVEAFLILEKELAAEGSDGQHNTRHAV